MGLNIEQIAQVAHETNAAYCRSIGDQSQSRWEDAEEYQRASAMSGIRFALDNLDAHPSEQHNAWMRQKVEDGWVYGEVKDPVAKTHPCMVSYAQLPIEQRLKDYLFKAVVAAFAQAGQE